MRSPATAVLRAVCSSARCAGRRTSTMKPHFRSAMSRYSSTALPHASPADSSSTTPASDPEAGQQRFPAEVYWPSSDLTRKLSSAVPTAEVGTNRIKLSWPSLRIAVPSRWLRDHCHCEKCVNQSTRQRAYDTFAKENSAPQASEVKTTQNALEVTWADGHLSHYPWTWIVKFASPSQATRPLSDRQIYRHWGQSIKDSPPTVRYEAVMESEAGVAEWTAKIRSYGFCFVDGCPPSPEETKALLERIAFIRTTHYGGFYDFTSDLTMKDTAYTSLALPAHTDTTYFTDPVGLQMFHMLSHTDGDGGASLLVDGFKCASQLRKQDPRAFRILHRTPIQWHASGNDGIVITPAVKQPVFSVRPNDKRVRQIRWNNDDRATIPLVLHKIDENSAADTEGWYEAAQLWHDIITSEENEYWEQLTPGRALIFDNWRVMHGRSVFTGKRRMSGGYINHDDFMSRYLNTNFPRKVVLNSIL